MSASASQERADSWADLSPLSYKYFNMLDSYHFAVLEEVLRGELRPLRLPEEADKELQFA